MKYRKKPVEVNAVQFDGSIASLNLILAMGRGERKVVMAADHSYLKIHTLEGVMTCDKGDYVIEGVRGELYPCKPEIFNETYEQI